MCTKLKDYHIRCVAEEHQLVKTVSASIGVTMSDFVREAIQRELKRHGFQLNAQEDGE